MGKLVKKMNNYLSRPILCVCVCVCVHILLCGFDSYDLTVLYFDPQIATD